MASLSKSPMTPSLIWQDTSNAPPSSPFPATLLSPIFHGTRRGHLSINTLSPVNQNGSFECDRVIKSGSVLKRARKTKNWKPAFMVLRPGLLSIYRDPNELKLRHQLNLSEMTAVARQRDPKRKSKHIFGLFSPSRNYHLEASTDEEAQEWVQLIRREARIDEEEEMVLASPTSPRKMFLPDDATNISTNVIQPFSREKLGSSSSEVDARRISDVAKERIPVPRALRDPANSVSRCSNDYASTSDFSDSGGPNISDLAIPGGELRRAPTNRSGNGNAIYGQEPPPPKRSESQLSGIDQLHLSERVVCQGWLWVLKSKGGVRQWKKHWAVLRSKAFTLYKTEDEYSAHLVLPLTGLIDAVEIDPPGKSKQYCMQLIAEERNYRCAAPDEDSLALWLGSLKSLVVRKKDREEGINAILRRETAGSDDSTTPKNPELGRKRALPTPAMVVVQQPSPR